MNNLGITALAMGQITRAAGLLDESLAYKRRMGNMRGIATSLVNLGRVAVAQGLLERAGALYAESLQILGAMGDPALVADSLEGWAQVAVGQERPRLALQVWGAPAALRETIGAVRPLSEQAAYTQAVATARDAVGQSRTPCGTKGGPYRWSRPSPSPCPTPSRDCPGKLVRARKARCAVGAEVQAEVMLQLASLMGMRVAE